ncbi:MAG: alcohol dehydrogenase catalytic domain-containing protein [Chloroflexi bacterium]|nr:alcohol dehydrogenase catalytic domain-containing protein [Chloroflexota bacterium]
MQAITVRPHVAGSARLEDIAEPPEHDGDVLVRTLEVGVCGTDDEIVGGAYGAPPPGRDWLVLGHESLGEVIDTPVSSGLQPGDVVVGIVRRPDPVPCLACATGEWDMCRNGLYMERGIKQLDGFASERFRTGSDFIAKLPPDLRSVGVLVEPTSVVAKAWEQIERIGARAVWQPRRVLITGAGPIGLLATLLAVQRGLDVHVLDLVTDGPKPRLVREVGATFHSGSTAEACSGADIVLECTGVGQVVFDVMRSTSPAGIICLTGVSTGGRTLGVDLGALNRDMVLENDVVFGSVNANRRHYEAAVQALARADREWLASLITRRVPLARWSEALQRDPTDVKTVIDFTR